MRTCVHVFVTFCLRCFTCYFSHCILLFSLIFAVPLRFALYSLRGGPNWTLYQTFCNVFDDICALAYCLSLVFKFGALWSTRIPENNAERTASYPEGYQEIVGIAACLTAQAKPGRHSHSLSTAARYLDICFFSSSCRWAHFQASFFCPFPWFIDVRPRTYVASRERIGQRGRTQGMEWSNQFYTLILRQQNNESFSPGTLRSQATKLY